MAITNEDVKKDLAEIKHYYQNKALFDKAVKKSITSLLEKVERYNSLLSKAPAKLYEIYYVLCVEGESYTAASYTMKCSTTTIFKRNKELIKYLVANL